MTYLIYKLNLFIYYKKTISQFLPKSNNGAKEFNWRFPEKLPDMDYMRL